MLTIYNISPFLVKIPPNSLSSRNNSRYVEYTRTNLVYYDNLAPAIECPPFLKRKQCYLFGKYDDMMLELAYEKGSIFESVVVFKRGAFYDDDTTPGNTDN